MLCGVQDELSKLQNFVKEESDKQFSIETSVFKVCIGPHSYLECIKLNIKLQLHVQDDIVTEITALFMTTLTRIPAKEGVAVSSQTANQVRFLKIFFFL